MSGRLGRVRCAALPAVPAVPAVPALLALLAVLGAAAPATAQQNLDTVRVTVQPVAGNVHVLFGSGGNMALLAGDDGAVLVDDQYAPLRERIRAAVATVSRTPVRFVINTHVHGDHTGGNENFGRTGAVIVAHDNVRTRLSAEQFNARLNRRTPAAPRGALPIVSFSESVTFHLNGDSVRVVHLPPAHTDGDAYIHFTRANVIHTGDVFNNGAYPLVDTYSGGSIDGYITAIDAVLAVADDRTRIIPGHGPVATRADLVEYRRVVATIRDRVLALVRAGKSLTEAAAAKPTAEFDDRWGKGFVTPDFLLDVVYNDLKARHGSR